MQREYTVSESKIPLWMTTSFSENPEEELIPIRYFKLFLKDEILNTYIENTILHRIQNSGTSVNSNKAEITSFIGIHILMGIVQIPIYKVCWSRELRFPSVADVMSINQYEQLRQYLHFLGNNASNNDYEKLFEANPIVRVIRDKCVKVEPEECHEKL